MLKKLSVLREGLPVFSNPTIAPVTAKTVRVQTPKEENIENEKTSTIPKKLSRRSTIVIQAQIPKDLLHYLQFSQNKSENIS